MNKKSTKQMVIGSLVIMAIILLAIQIKISKINYEKRHQNNDSYVDYVCKDRHLVCVKEGECIGRKFIKGDGPDYEYYYNLIEDVSDDDFIAAYKFVYASLSGRNIVLQSPDNDTNVLKDWKIKEIEVFYFDDNEEGGLFQKESATRQGDYIIHSIACTSDSAIIEELLDTILNSSRYTSFHKCVDKDNYEYVYMYMPSLYLRLHFEEMESLVWDAYISFYRDKTDNSKYEITLYYHTYGDETESESYEIQLDSSSELYQMIWEAYQENLVQFVEEKK